MERGAERFAGMIVVPDASGGPCALAQGPGRRPRPDSPVPDPSRSQAGSRSGASRPRASLGGRRGGGLRLARPYRQWGIPACAALGTQGVERVASALRGCPRVFLAFDNDDAGREATERLLTLLGRRAAAVTLPHGVGDVAELATHPHGRATFLRLLALAARSAR